MKTKKVWTVVWTHYNNEMGIGEDDCFERVNRFSTEAKALDFARFRTNHSEAASPFVDEVPARIASRWTID